MSYITVITVITAPGGVEVRAAIWPMMEPR
jgi:hypothetical protein